MTEDEAKTTMCCGPPLVASIILATQPGGFADYKAGKCIGAACMAWRWHNPEDFPAGLRGDGPATRTHGFCGMAGYPHDD